VGPRGQPGDGGGGRGRAARAHVPDGRRRRRGPRPAARRHGPRPARVSLSLCLSVSPSLSLSLSASFSVSLSFLVKFRTCTGPRRRRGGGRPVGAARRALAHRCRRRVLRGPGRPGGRRRGRSPAGGMSGRTRSGCSWCRTSQRSC
jgi:hypothetical protein